MKTFDEFISERYYRPDEKLPSGKTPVQKASENVERRTNKFKSLPQGKRTIQSARKIITQKKNTERFVKHGSENSDYNLYSSPGVKVEKEGKRLKIHHHSGVSFYVSPRGKTETGEKEHEVLAGNRNYNASPAEKRKLIRIAKRVFKKEVVPRVPRSEVLKSWPMSNENTNKITRAKIARTVGFGPQERSTGEQRGKVIGSGPRRRLAPIIPNETK